MLIVNADDLGRCRKDTDRALACHERGRINSTSAMMFMADSERAAMLAREAGLPVGLHLNLTECFSAADVAPELRECHDRVCRFLNTNRYALLLFHPLLARDFTRVVAAQFSEFRRLYGREPAHVDGHQHMHLCSNVLLQRLLPQGARVRRSFSFEAGEKSWLNRWYRARVDRALLARHRLVDHFFSLSQQMVGSRLDKVLELAGQGEVELMVHPAWQNEYDYLMSDAFSALLDRVRAAEPQPARA